MKQGVIQHIILIVLFSIASPSFGQENPTQKNCLECHKKLYEKSFMHAPSKAACLNCHISTGKNHPEKDEEGFTLKEKVPQLCYTCHDPLNTMKTVHRPVKKGNCLGCHEMHSSNDKKLISSLPPDLCLFCHSALGKNVDTAKTVHEVIRKGMACLSCHVPHQSNEPRLLNKAQKDLCLQCHNKPITKDQHVIPNIQGELSRNKYVHGAILKNGCTGCHDPHASVQNSLLKGLFSTANYVSGKSKDNIALCFNCHTPALLEQKVTDSTGFRDGEKNLHFKHVNKFKGRNCVNCHGIHSAPNEFLLMDKVKFGNWDMPLNFTKTETGGKCITACHAPKTYSRVIQKAQ